MMNRVCIEGRLVADPTYKKIESTNQDFVSFTIASQRPYKNKDGQMVADFIRVVAYHHIATYVHNKFHKGERVSVSGRLVSNSYQNEVGEKVYTVYIQADEVNFLG